MGPCQNPNCHSYGKPHPNCRCYMNYADGGDVQVDDSKDTAELEGNASQQPQIEASPSNDIATSLPANTQVPNPPDGSPQASTLGGQAAFSPLPGTAPLNGQDLRNEAALYQGDINNGHITPKTYADLMGKGDTLSKLGTLFGLMVSGAGAGLSHQPNMLMQMMDKTLERDLDAQKTSATNTMNMYRINQANQMNQAHIAQFQKLGLLTDAQAREANANANLASFGLTNMQNNINALHHFSEIVNNMPEGPARNQASIALGQVAQHFDLKNANIADLIQSQSGLLNAINNPQGNSNPVPQGGNINWSGLNQIQQMGQLAAQSGTPTSLTGDKISQANTEAGHIEQNRAAARMYNDSFQNLNSMVAAGRLTPDYRAAQIKTLAKQIGNMTGEDVNTTATQADAFFPQVGDTDMARQAKLNKMNQLFQNQEANTPALDALQAASRIQLKTPFPYQINSPAQSQQNFIPAGEIRTTKNGKRAISDGKGGWKPAQ